MASEGNNRTLAQMLDDLDESAHQMLDLGEEIRERLSGLIGEAGAGEINTNDDERDTRHRTRETARAERRNSGRLKKDGTPDLRFKDAQVEAGQRS